MRLFDLWNDGESAKEAPTLCPRYDGVGVGEGRSMAAQWRTVGALLRGQDSRLFLLLIKFGLNIRIVPILTAVWSHWLLIVRPGIFSFLTAGWVRLGNGLGPDRLVMGCVVTNSHCPSSKRMNIGLDSI